MSEDETSLRFHYAISIFEIERTPPTEWDDQYVPDPFFGGERFCDVVRTIEDEDLNRGRPLLLCPQTGMRVGIPGIEFVPSFVTEGGYRKRLVTRSDHRRNDRKRKKTSQKYRQEFKERSTRERQAKQRAEKEEDERREREDHSSRVLFALRQCRFSRKQAHILDGMGEPAAAAQLVVELRSHQHELLRLRRVKQAA